MSQAKKYVPLAMFRMAPLDKSEGDLFRYGFVVSGCVFGSGFGFDFGFGFGFGANT